jgi:hypothetical protein
MVFEGLGFFREATRGLALGAGMDARQDGIYLAVFQREWAWLRILYP